MPESDPAPASVVTESSRDPSAIRSMFERIAERYDLANHLLSGGIDFWWRAQAAAIVRQWQPPRILDLACGSGDLALALAQRLPQSDIVAADFSPAMLAIARRKGVAKTIEADALSLPFPNAAFDCVTVAFGLRNMADYDRALREMARVLSPGGHLLILDFAIPNSRLQHVYRFYLHRILPLAAALVTGQKHAYEYFGGSIEKFPHGRAMLQLLERNGFANATARNLTGGIAVLYTATPNEK